MLTERTRSVQKDVDEVPDLYCGSESGRSQSDVGGDSHKGGSLFSLSLSSLFWGFNRKGSSDSDSLRSPTSHLDHSLFSCLISPFRSPRSPSPQEGLQKFWDSSKVGLSVIDSVKQNANESVGDAVAQVCDSRNVLLGPKARVKPHNPENSVTENYQLPPNRVKSPLHKGSSGVVFEIGGATDAPEPVLSGKTCSCLVDSPGVVNCPPPQGIKETLKSGNLISSRLAENGPFESLPEDELELSEDYTRVTLHGPNPKTTHIYGDCILDCHPKELSNNFEMKVEGLMDSSPRTATYYPTVDFLSCCYTCKKFLEEGKDIYMYRGEKAFCSVDCREEEILFDEEIDKKSGGSSGN